VLQWWIMEIKATSIPAVKILRPTQHGDDRGFFSETYNKKILQDLGLDIDFVQDNHAFSTDIGTVRGLHFQIPPFAQDKLVRVISGRILDVAVDLRSDSPTFGQHVAVEISADAWNQILVPVGFAHGLCVLEKNTQVIYKVSNYYSKAHDKGLHWQDQELAINWPVKTSDAILSAKDKVQPMLQDLPKYF
jgi:dTDP-4-dehydrorhamnose 3,5-epimerase